MDIPRPFAAQARRRRRVLYGLAGVLLVGAITMGVSRLKPALPSVERSSVWVDIVKRGPLVRQVRGLGSLTPEEIRWIPTITDGRVEKVLVRPGAKVKADTVLVVLTNPAVTQQAFDAQWKLLAEEAQYHNLEVTLESQALDQKANAARARQEAEDAQMKADTDAELSKVGIIAAQALRVSTGSARQLNIRADIEDQRYLNAQKQLRAQLAAEKARVEEARAIFDLQQKQQNMLQLRAGVDGILQELSLNGNPLQEGQQVTAGTTIAKVANPLRLKAELKIPESQTKDVQLGQTAEVDTHNGVIEGKVTRIDPSVLNGTRTVDVALVGDLPPGAVPDLSVEGTIDLERISSVLLVGRPASGQEETTIGLFKLEADGKTAARVQVMIGRSSTNSVEILGGLKDGDEVILSDMSRWDQYDRVRLE
ncbi:MAG TPA: efflux RND transporter periplasmic adaptor subunit [Terriglobales bacterium]|nr:efflux RND transporter periplasmic adaptor subunit [Terriglobales bacterium]